MLRNQIVVFVLAGMVCYAYSWRVFPLPDLPVYSSPTTSSYVALKSTSVTLKAPLPQTNVASTTTAAPFAISTVFKPGTSLSTQKVKEPAKDLLPPKEDLPV